jgi:hypothetical protein
LDPKLAKLLATSDNDLIREAEKEGHNVPALVQAMKVRIAEKLSEVSGSLPKDPNRQTKANGVTVTWYREQARAGKGARLRIALEHKISRIDLGPVSYLAILQHGWSQEEVSTVEQRYRCWLQDIHDSSDAVPVSDEEVDLYRQCHLMISGHEVQMRSVFGDSLPSALYTGTVSPGSPPAGKPQGPARSPQPHWTQSSVRVPALATHEAEPERKIRALREEASALAKRAAVGETRDFACPRDEARRQQDQKSKKDRYPG